MIFHTDTFIPNISSDNPRFLEVLVANRARFKSLRALTVEGAMAEMEREAQERKDRGTTESASVRSNSRGPSFDGVQSPTSARSPSLGMVPEDDRFAIGDEDDEDIGDTARPTSLSEKARGKQPEATSRASSVSRNVSTSSLQSLALPPRDNLGGGFRPSQPWLDSWYSRLPLDPIFRVIETAESKQKQKSFSSRTTDGLRTNVDGGKDVAKDIDRE